MKNRDKSQEWLRFQDSPDPSEKNKHALERRRAKRACLKAYCSQGALIQRAQHVPLCMFVCVCASEEESVSKWERRVRVGGWARDSGIEEGRVGGREGDSGRDGETENSQTLREIVRQVNGLWE